MEPLITTEEGMQEYGNRLEVLKDALYNRMDAIARDNATSAGYLIVSRNSNGELHRIAALPSDAHTGQVIYLQKDDEGYATNPNALRKFAKMSSDGRETRKQIASLLREVRYLRHPHNRQEELANGGYVPRHSF